MFFALFFTASATIAGGFLGMLESDDADCASCEADCSDESDTCNGCLHCICCDMTNFAAAFASADGFPRPLVSTPVFIPNEPLAMSTNVPVFRPPKTAV